MADRIPARVSRRRAGSTAARTGFATLLRRLRTEVRLRRELRAVWCRYCHDRPTAVLTNGDEGFCSQACSNTYVLVRRYQSY